MKLFNYEALEDMFEAISTRYVDGMLTSKVTPVTIQYIHPPNHGYP